jgi:hypothetical protein
MLCYVVSRYATLWYVNATLWYVIIRCGTLQYVAAARHTVTLESGTKWQSAEICIEPFTYLIDPNNINTATFYKEYPNMVLKCVRRHLRTSEIKLTFF